MIGHRRRHILVAPPGPSPFEARLNRLAPQGDGTKGVTVDMTEERVFIAGAGPVGLTAAASLVRHGVPVTVFEAGGDLAEESRASTFHPPTLDMLDELGAAGPL